MARAVTDKEKQAAQKYAQDALSGKSGVYIPASQTANAVINAGVPIKTAKEKVTAPATTATPAVQQDSTMTKYLQELDRQRTEKQARLDAQYSKGKQNINDEAARGNKQAYTAFMQGMKNMPQKAAMYGAGGMAQSLANKSQLNYENNRNNIEQARVSALADLESDYRGGVINMQDDYLSKLSAARTNAVTTSGSGKATATPVTSAGYRIGDNQTVHAGTDEQALTGLINELMGMGFTKEQAKEYIMQQM